MDGPPPRRRAPPCSVSVPVYAEFPTLLPFRPWLPVSWWDLPGLVCPGHLASESLLVTNPLIYAEVSVAFERIEDVEAVLRSTVFRREQRPSSVTCRHQSWAKRSLSWFVFWVPGVVTALVLSRKGTKQSS